MGTLASGISAALGRADFLQERTEWSARVSRARAYLKGLQGKDAVVVVAEKDAPDYLASVFVGMERGYALVLASPDWGELQWRALARSLDGVSAASGGLTPLPACYYDTAGQLTKRSMPKELAGTLSLGTGGSSGALRMSTHDIDTLEASVQATDEFFNPPSHSAVCLLPLNHVSGLMQAMRAACFGGQLWLGSPREWEEAMFVPRHWVSSVVPTLLNRWLQEPHRIERLRAFHTLYTGGAALSGTLLAQARRDGLALAPVYGMTETASMILGTRPEEVDEQGVQGTCLPHCSVTLHPDQTLRVRARSLHRAYLDELLLGDFLKKTDYFDTGDIAQLTDTGRVRILGRADTIINTGGLKVSPERIESCLQDHSQIAEAAVCALPDNRWGQIVCCLYVPRESSRVTIAELETYLRLHLSPEHLPKRWKAVDILPRNSRHKLERSQLPALMESR